MAKQKNPYEIDFEEYIRHTDASKKEKTLAWSTAIGLQQVDGLTPSSYLYETARRNIEGDISFDEAKRLVDSYYKKKTAVEKGIQEKPIYLERFFRNLLLNEHHELKNRFTHIDYDEYMKKSSQKGSQKSSQKIIEMIKQNSEITTQEMADNLGITRRAVAKSIAKLQEQGVVRRVGADKGGHWEVLNRENVDG